MAHPYSDKSRGREKANCYAEGGMVVPMGISLAQSDANRLRLSKALSSTAAKYGQKDVDAAVKQLPSAQVINSPYANKKRGGRT